MSFDYRLFFVVRFKQDMTKVSAAHKIDSMNINKEANYIYYVVLHDIRDVPPSEKKNFNKVGKSSSIRGRMHTYNSIKGMPYYVELVALFEVSNVNLVERTLHKYLQTKYDVVDGKEYYSPEYDRNDIVADIIKHFDAKHYKYTQCDIENNSNESVNDICAVSLSYDMLEQQFKKYADSKSSDGKVSVYITDRLQNGDKVYDIINLLISNYRRCDYILNNSNDENGNGIYAYHIHNISNLLTHVSDMFGFDVMQRYCKKRDANDMKSVQNVLQYLEEHKGFPISVKRGSKTESADKSIQSKLNALLRETSIALYLANIFKQKNWMQLYHSVTIDGVVHLKDDCDIYNTMMKIIAYDDKYHKLPVSTPKNIYYSHESNTFINDTDYDKDNCNHEIVSRNSFRETVISIKDQLMGNVVHSQKYEYIKCHIHLVKNVLSRWFNDFDYSNIDFDVCANDVKRNGVNSIDTSQTINMIEINAQNEIEHKLKQITKQSNANISKNRVLTNHNEQIIAQLEASQRLLNRLSNLLKHIGEQFDITSNTDIQAEYDNCKSIIVSYQDKDDSDTEDTNDDIPHVDENRYKCLHDIEEPSGDTGYKGVSFEDMYNSHVAYVQYLKRTNKPIQKPSRNFTNIDCDGVVFNLGRNISHTNRKIREYESGKNIQHIDEIMNLMERLKQLYDTKLTKTSDIVGDVKNAIISATLKGIPFYQYKVVVKNAKQPPNLHDLLIYSLYDGTSDGKHNYIELRNRKSEIADALLAYYDVIVSRGLYYRESGTNKHNCIENIMKA